MGPDPESGFYLKPKNCKNNQYALGPNAFSLTCGTGQPVGADDRYFAGEVVQPAQPANAQRLTGLLPTRLRCPKATC